MICGVAFCPQPPLLVPAVASGAATELDDVRAACRDAIARVGTGRRLVLIGGGPDSLSHRPPSRGTLAGFGVPAEIDLGPPGEAGAHSGRLPLSLTVGAWLVQDALGPRNGAVAFSVGPAFVGSRAALDLRELVRTREVALIVLGDGSARRSTAAPGYLDERAAGFDAGVAAVLRSGDGAALEAIDAGLGEQLLAAGVPAWHAAGAVLAGDGYDADLLYDGAPYGVGYFVAAWTRSAGAGA